MALFDNVPPEEHHHYQGGEAGDSAFVVKGFRVQDLGLKVSVNAEDSGLGFLLGV